MTSKISFNGKDYASLDDMPPDVRAAYQQIMGIFADKDQDGTPDIFQGGQANVISNSSTTIVYNGQTYSSADDLPPEARQKYEAAMSKLDTNRDGVPDWLAGATSAGARPTNQDEIPEWLREVKPREDAGAAPGVRTPDKVIQPDSSNCWLILVGIVLFLVVVGASLLAVVLLGR